ncbi:uncharacterized protein TNCV_192911 [Trichonephila clavipes]|nr:uncharacterized protein TNCV_192911 [Trichonephila clavipes]
MPEMCEPQNHHDDCYFCVAKINGINPGNRNKWSYPNLSTAQRPQLKSREVQPSTSKSSNDPNPCDPERNTSSENSDSDYKFSQDPQPFNQKELSDFDSRDKQHHWSQIVWPLREELKVGTKNVINTPLVSRDRIILPPLDIKLGIMKQFVNALDKSGECFNFLSRNFPRLRIEKLKAGIFDGPQIRQLVEDSNVVKSMTEVESKAWNAFVLVMSNFLGKKISDDPVELVESMLLILKELGCNMSIKIHFLHSHLYRFPQNLGDFSEEQGKRFHQHLRTMKQRYQGRWGSHMMSDYCWSLQRDLPKVFHSRKSYKRSFHCI